MWPPVTVQVSAAFEVRSCGDCKSAGLAFPGSNRGAATRRETPSDPLKGRTEHGGEARRDRDVPDLPPRSPLQAATSWGAPESVQLRPRRGREPSR